MCTVKAFKTLFYRLHNHIILGPSNWILPRCQVSDTLPKCTLGTPWMAYLLIVDVCMQRISSWRYLMLEFTTSRGFSSKSSTKKHIRTCLHSSNRSPWPRCRCHLLCRLCRSCLNLQKFLWPLDPWPSTVFPVFPSNGLFAFSIFTQDFQYSIKQQEWTFIYVMYF